MKKTAIALAIAGLAVASAAQAAPQANTFYAGARVGWASFHDGVDDFKSADSSVKSNSVTYGVFGGYQIIDNLAVELGYDHYGTMKVTNPDAKADKFTNHGVNLSLKPSYDLGNLTPVLEGLDAYARVGAALIRSDVKAYEADGSKVTGHSLKVSPVFAAGLEYAIPGFTDLAARVEYQWINGVGKDQKWSGNDGADFTPDIGSVTFGLSYRFGQGAPVVPEVVNKTFTLNSDVTFGFDKASLKPEAQNVLDGVYGEIAQVKSAQVAVAGYTDRIGSEAYNLKLSQQRAETVANYLVSKGIAQQDISATGYGKANPVTGSTCDAVKGRKALIACLAPDRRVEIAVKGTK
ncbi:OOP family OmpA-OmpF porin [Mesocricetibacter intestinalis]|uniref:Outer membrane protein A n=1 Tax=Mesocricetibacter intestinalis TaxID=1521930 RepID=A0A4R6VBG5_9PAST|nr:porin OmpA [Mesocricetibacter intestinalis]TDQ57156.1 OOP family OmpA-OmpF porin [Mesocricetibacter intestinalis]